jgi:hypothetical protein
MKENNEIMQDIVNDPTRRIAFRDMMARALYAEYCKSESLYIRDDISIRTAWAADGRNRKMWTERAERVLIELVQACYNGV